MKIIKDKQCTNNLLVEQVDTMLNREAKGPKISSMDVNTVNPIETSLRTLQISNVENFMDGDRSPSTIRIASVILAFLKDNPRLVMSILRPYSRIFEVWAPLDNCILTPFLKCTCSKMGQR